jgi:transposase
MNWALAPDGWRVSGNENAMNLREIDDTSANENIYYKERRIRSEVMDEQGRSQILEQNLIVSYSPKYKAYQQRIRAGQVERAQRMLNNPTQLNRRHANDPARFIEQSHVTVEGEVAKHRKAALSQQSIDKEAMFDGFYGICTNLDDDIKTIIRINKGRWEIEESFRMLKSEFRSRPVYLSRAQRIKAHFLICFLGLLTYRIMERMLGLKYTSSQIVQTLRSMNFHELKDEGYIPIYTRTAITDSLHEAFGYDTDRRLMTKKR